MEELKISQIEKKASQLFKDCLAAFAASADENIRKKTVDLPTKLINDDRAINVVFVGQYSAGKSSLISALTGKSLKIGGGITTDKVSSFEYNGLTITDTPGVHTQNRPDHDAITYEAISKADLIVFVMTNEPIGDFMGGHLRNLIFDKSKGREMMIVVNKMMDSESGNVPKQRKIYIDENLNPQIAPYNAEDFYTSFVDVNAYNEFLSSGDALDLEDSGFEHFKANLNRFVEDKKLIGRCTTSLFELESALENAVDSVKIGDECVDGSIHILNQKRRKIEDAKLAILEKSALAVSKKGIEIQRWGEEIANNLKSSDKEQEVNLMLQDKYHEVEKSSEVLKGEIETILKNEVGSLQESLKELDNTQFAKDIKTSIQNKLKNTEISSSTFNALSKAGSYSSQLGTWLSNQCAGQNAATQSIFKLGAYSGSKGHDVVLTVGHLFGHKFKPWEAVKWTRGIGVAGKCLGVAGAGIGLVLQVVNDKNTQKVEDGLRNARGEIRQCFNDVGNVIEMTYDESTKTWIAENIEPSISEIDEQIQEINSMIQSKNEEYDRYSSLLRRTRALISEIQS